VSASRSTWRTLGHEVIVADPNYAPMNGHRSRRIKTDRQAWRR